MGRGVRQANMLRVSSMHLPPLTVLITTVVIFNAYQEYTIVRQICREAKRLGLVEPPRSSAALAWAHEFSTASDDSRYPACHETCDKALCS